MSGFERKTTTTTKSYKKSVLLSSSEGSDPIPLPSRLPITASPPSAAASHYLSLLPTGTTSQAVAAAAHSLRTKSPLALPAPTSFSLPPTSSPSSSYYNPYGASASSSSVVPIATASAAATTAPSAYGHSDLLPVRKVRFHSVLNVPFIGRAPTKTVVVPKAVVEAEPPLVRTQKTVMCSYKAISEEIQSRRSMIKQESLSYREESTGKFRQIQLNRLPLTIQDGNVEATIKTPSGQLDKGTVVDHKDGTISLRYDPKEEGMHEIIVKSVAGSPFKVFVDSLGGGHVSAHGPGLSHGVAGDPCNFTIVAKGCPVAGLQVAVEGPSKAEMSCLDNKDGTVSASYLPETPGEYRISVRYTGKEIKGSPFIAKVTGESRKRAQLSVGHSSDITLKIAEKDIRSLVATIVTPGGCEEPCFIKKLPNNSLGISFTPRDSGQHFVNVRRSNKHIPGSPFMINVLEREIGDASKVRVSGPGLKDAKTQVENDILVDAKNAGFGGLSVSCEGPSKADIVCRDHEEGNLRVCYKPTEPGYYLLNLKFADQHVPGSPFTVKVTGPGSGLQQHQVKQPQVALPVTDVGCECKLSFKMRGTNISNMTAKVTSPSGKVEEARVVDMSDCLYGVQFVPKEIGVHKVTVKYKDIPIPGSPFQFTVGPLKDYGSHRVHAGGNGLQRGVVKEPCEFNVWTREAGAGNLSLSVEGPSKAEIDFKDRKDGSCYVSYKVLETGEYKVSIKFNDQHIPDSPYRVYILPQVMDAKKITVGPLPTNLQIKRPVTLTVHTHGLKGVIDAKVVSPNGLEDDCFISTIDEETSGLKFIPKENGVHSIHVRFNGIHIPLSPFKVRVGEENVDPKAVRAYGPGIGDVIAGVKQEFTIDTRKAGQGNLAVTVDGPAKVAMDCTEVKEGYTVRYTPMTVGEYYLSVKYNQSHIAGSPFRVNCMQALESTQSLSQSKGDTTTSNTSSSSKQKVTQSVFPNKVGASGIGLTKAFVGKVNSFTVNCSNAGQSCLFASMFGPGGPCDLNLKHVGGNVYSVNYQVSERGVYTLHVKWGDDHIPGSPFKIEAA